jgi:hypothetical protein
VGDLLREHRWHLIIGTWVDEDTRGGTIKVTYAWKFKDQLIQVTSKIGDRKTVGLMGLNRKTGDVYYLAGDDEGGCSRGQWEIEAGDAILNLAHVNAEGQESEASIRHHLKNDNTLLVSMNDDPSTLTLVRVKK